MFKDKKVIAIVATGNNGEIGKDNALLWHIRAELQHFKQVTLGNVLLMGRKTVESLPQPLNGRIVVEFSKKQNKLELKNEELFFTLIRDSFVQKRKTLRNNLKVYDLHNIEETLKKYNMDLNIRAEQISIDIFVDIANNLK